MWPLQVLSLRIRLDLKVIVMKEYTEFPKAPELEPHHQMQFSPISRTLLCRDAVGVFYSSSQMGWFLKSITTEIFLFLLSRLVHWFNSMWTLGSNYMYCNLNFKKQVEPFPPYFFSVNRWGILLGAPIWMESRVKFITVTSAINCDKKFLSNNYSK